MTTCKYESMSLNQILKKSYVENVEIFNKEITEMITCHYKGYLNQEGQDHLKKTLTKIIKFNEVHNFPDRTIVDLTVNDLEAEQKSIRCYKFNRNYVVINTKKIIYCVDGDCYNSQIDAAKKINAFSIRLQRVVNIPNEKRALAS